VPSPRSLSAAGLEQRVRVDPVLETEVAVDLETIGEAEAERHAVDRDVFVLGVTIQVVAEELEGELSLGQRVGRGHVEEPGGSVVGRGRGMRFPLATVDRDHPRLDVRPLHRHVMAGVARSRRGGGLDGGVARSPVPFLPGRRHALGPGGARKGEQPSEHPGCQWSSHRTSSFFAGHFLLYSEV